ncbi:MAG: hypothetical protein HY747_09610 [Elusimicrobia bacterium]|nr:hypothetical protein [Elusimicrobiota bacterium]
MSLKYRHSHQKMFLAAALAAGVVCGAPMKAAAAKTAGLYGLPPLPRMEFNRLAIQANTPTFWADDAKNPGVLDSDELAGLGVNAGVDKYVSAGGFTAEFEKIYRQFAEAYRKEIMRQELDQGLATLVATDLTALPAKDKEFLRHIVKAAGLIDELHLKQKGALAFVLKMESADPESKAAFARNQGPWCEAPKTEKNHFCSSLPDFPDRLWDTYPSDEPQDEKFCQKLQGLADGKDLLAPFVVVRKNADKYEAVSYSKVYEKEMKAIAEELKAAAKTLDPSREKALQRYLSAAAKGFETNSWQEADEAWAAMNAVNSAWYLRIAPDEVYWDLCQEKAGFHVSFARIDQGSLEWQKKLNPLRDEMEQSLAKLIGDPYKARPVKFRMPDFIGIILNAGDSRHPLGAVTGQSLPNWGKVATEGRGRTVVMTNLYTDPDSLKLARRKAESMLTPQTMAYFTEEKLPDLLGTIIHEAMHNLGPYSDYKIDGKGPSDIFGGKLASTMEELKAQTGSLYNIELLEKRGVISEELAKQIYVRSIAWCFGHISQGMTDGSGNPKTYSQLSAVQIGFFAEEGALVWDEAPDSAGGRTVGKFNLNFDKIAPAVEKLMQKVGRIKATGDVAGAKALVEPYVGGDKKHFVRMEEIEDRLLKFPKASMVYSVKY